MHTFAAIRFFAESMRREEVEKTVSRLPELKEDGREALEAMTKALVNKLLHHPFAVLRQMSEEDVEGISVESVQKLFGVEPESEEGLPEASAEDAD